VGSGPGNVRLAVIGVGLYGGVLARTARTAGLAEIVSCFDISPERREQFAREIDCRPVETLDALLADPDVDGVLIATPHSTHPEIVEQAASASKHVFVEKPLALTVMGANSEPCSSSRRPRPIPGAFRARCPAGGVTPKSRRPGR
jgi:predicted dehydrogenase